MSDTETLVGDESPDSPSTERLLAKMPQGIDGPGVPENPRWSFMRLMRHRPMQILSVTMFLNQ